MDQVLQALPWVVVLFLLVTREISAWRQQKLIETIVNRGQGVPDAKPVQPAAPPAVPALPSLPSSPFPSLPDWLKTLPLPNPELPPVQPSKPAPPKASGPFADYPIWFNVAAREIGTREEGVNGGPAISRYIAGAHAGSIGDPWCAIFANYCLETSGTGGTRSASSQSFRNHPDFVQLDGPARGAIVVYWRGSQSSGLGHVGFYLGEDGGHVWTLGGNESDMVQIEALPKSSASFGLIGYWWPRKVALPKVGAVMVQAGTPAHITKVPAGVPTTSPVMPSLPSPAGAVPANQQNIIATYFGGEGSAYGGDIIDSEPGVALPFRFRGERPLVRVTNRASGRSVVCKIVDVGPWNINDPYWSSGQRPQAESGFDLGQVSNGVPRKTNGAGIDLTLAAAAAIGIDGKGRVDWQFEPDASNGPKVT